MDGLLVKAGIGFMTAGRARRRHAERQPRLRARPDDRGDARRRDDQGPQDPHDRRRQRLRLHRLQRAVRPRLERQRLHRPRRLRDQPGRVARRSARVQRRPGRPPQGDRVRDQRPRPRPLRRHRGRDRLGRRPAAEPRRLRRRARRHRPASASSASPASPRSAASPPSFNVGASTSGGFSPIDFIASFPDSDGEAGADQVGYEVFTGDKNNPILLGYDDFLFQLQLVGAVALQDVFALVGFFYLEVDSQGLKLLTAGRMVIGPDLGSYNPTTGVISTSNPPMLSIQALGALVINGSGVALDIDVDIDVSVPGLDLVRVGAGPAEHDRRHASRSPSRRGCSTSSTRSRSTAGSPPPTRRTRSSRSSRTTCSTASAPAAGGTGRCYSIDGRAPNILVSTTLFNLLHNPAGPIVRLGAGPYVVVVMSGGFDFLGFARGDGRRGHRHQLGAGGTTVPVRLRRRVLDRRGRDRARLPGRRRDRAVAGGRVHRRPRRAQRRHHLALPPRRQRRPRRSTRGPAGTANDYFILQLSGRLDVAGPDQRERRASRSGSAARRLSSTGSSTRAAPTRGASRSRRATSSPATSGRSTITLWGFIQSDGQFSVHASASIRLGIDGFGIEGTIAAGASLIKVDYDDDGLFENDEYQLTFYVTGSVRVEAFGIGIAGAERHRLGERPARHLGHGQHRGLRRPALRRRVHRLRPLRHPAARHDPARRARRSSRSSRSPAAPRSSSTSAPTRRAAAPTCRASPPSRTG